MHESSKSFSLATAENLLWFCGMARSFRAAVVTGQG
jgi:hypothetical protein